MTYQEIAKQIAAQDGSLTGYAGGLDRKEKLLELEQKMKQSKSI